MRGEARNQVMAQNVFGGFHVFARIQRIVTGHAFAPALAIGGDGANQQDVAGGLGAERRAER